jgi:hypothetical protein
MIFHSVKVLSRKVEMQFNKHKTMVGEFGLITISFLVRKNNSMTNIIKTSDVHGNCTRNTLMQLMKFTTFNTFRVFG